MAARITREFLDRMRDDPDFLEATPGDASEAVAIIDLAISALSHPAALERAHKENEEACRYLERLVANVAPSPTKPLAGDLIGLCTQVDNLMCWVRERARAEGAVTIANGFILSRDLLRRVVPLLHWMIAHRAKVGPDNAVAAAAIATAIGALPSDPCAPDGALNTALEAARAEERERCAKIAADRIMAARLGDLDADLRSIAGSIDHDIRALSALSPQTDGGAS